jgi:hypothetical protein
MRVDEVELNEYLYFLIHNSATFSNVLYIFFFERTMAGQLKTEIRPATNVKEFTVA